MIGSFSQRANEVVLADRIAKYSYRVASSS